MRDSVRTRGMERPVRRKARKAGVRRGAPIFFDACHGDGAARGLSGQTFDGFSVCVCTHFLSGAKRCQLWTWHSWPPNVSRHDVVVPSKVLYSTSCLCLFSSLLNWTLTFGPSHAFTSSRQTPVLRARGLVRRLCPESFGPFSTISLMKKVAQ